MEIKNRGLGNGERVIFNAGIFKGGNLKNWESLKARIFKMGNLQKWESLKAGIFKMRNL